MKTEKQYSPNQANLAGRREFMTTLTKAALGSSLLVNTPGFANAKGMEAHRANLTVGQVMELILKTIPGAPFPKTVDTLKAGKADQNVTGIVTTMFATAEVIQQTIALGANFIIAHEPTFYNHLDETDWLQQSDVFRYKEDLLKKHNIAVWRFHDYWHAHRPDGIRKGVLTALGWEAYADAQNPRLLTLPVTSLRELISHAKQKLGIQTVRVVGDLAQPCQRILLMPGSSGGKSQIEAIQQTKPDALLCGELSEWETAEYVRDARYKGDKLSLVVLGHEMSEEPGMQWLVTWLQPQVPALKVTHISSKNPFTYV